MLTEDIIVMLFVSDDYHCLQEVFLSKGQCILVWVFKRGIEQRSSIGGTLSTHTHNKTPGPTGSKLTTAQDDKIL